MTSLMETSSYQITFFHLRLFIVIDLGLAEGNQLIVNSTEVSLSNFSGLKVSNLR